MFKVNDRRGRRRLLGILTLGLSLNLQLVNRNIAATGVLFQQECSPISLID